MNKNQFTPRSSRLPARQVSGGGPIEYKKGFTDFVGSKINLSMKPMIPRKETEFWVKKAIQEIKKTDKKISFLDIFAGSGCIGIAVLKNCSEQCRKAIFAELDPGFIKQIKINLKLNKINPRTYKIIQSDVFKSIKGKYDYIFANPPYIPLKNKHLVQGSVLNFEPHTALFGGDNGLFFIQKFLKQAKKHLKPKGEIYVEFDHFQKRELEKLLKELNYKNYKIYKDQFRKWRYIRIFDRI